MLACWWNYVVLQYCRPHDKQLGAGNNLDDAGLQVLKDAESELVKQEVAAEGGVVRGSVAAKVQVSLPVIPDIAID